jgi:hypothetical protein
LNTNTSGIGSDTFRSSNATIPLKVRETIIRVSNFSCVCIFRATSRVLDIDIFVRIDFFGVVRPLDGVGHAVRVVEPSLTFVLI